MTNILFLIAGIILGFYIKGKVTKTFIPKGSDELDEMRGEAHEALAERTEKRKEKILDFIKSEAVHQEELKTCNLDGSKTGQVTTADVEKLLEVSSGTARKYLNQLESENKIKQVGNTGPDVYYTLNA